MNSLANVPIVEPEEDESNMINLGEHGRFHMTKGLYIDLMSDGQHDIIPQKWHDRFFDDYYKWYHNEHSKYMNEMNPVLNRNNVPSEFNAIKTSGRQARNKKAAFSGKKNKTARKALNVFKNKRSKRRAQVLAPLNQLRNTIKAAYNNTNNNSNLTDEQDVFIKMWAVNFLNGIILNSTSYSDFERKLEEPLSSGISHQPQSVRNNIKNTMLIPNTPLIDMFKAKLYLTKEQLETYKNTYLSGSYDYKPLYKQLDQNSNNDSISLIDVKTINFYYADYYFPNAILAAISKNNLEIFNKILEFNPRIDNSISRDLFYGVINDYTTEINPEILRIIFSKIDLVAENHILSRIARLQKRWILESLLDTKKIDTDKMYRLLFERIRKQGLLEREIGYALEVIEIFKEKNIKPAPGFFEEEFLYLLNSRPFITRNSNFYNTELLQRLFIEMLPEINVNKPLPNDPEGNTIFMAMIRSHWALGPEVIEMIVTRPDFNPNKKNQLGETALAIAIKLNKSSIAQRLMRIPGAHLEAKNIYGLSPMNHLKTGVAPNIVGPIPVAEAAPLNEWNNFNNVARGRTTRRNNYRNMMRTYEKAIKPRVAMTMGAKKVWVPDPETGYRKPVNLGPNLGRHIASFVPSAAPNQ